MSPDIGSDPRSLRANLLSKEIELADKRTQQQRWRLEILAAEAQIERLHVLINQLEVQLTTTDAVDLANLRAAVDNLPAGAPEGAQ